MRSRTSPRARRQATRWSTEQLDIAVAGCAHPIDAETERKIDEIYRVYTGAGASCAR